MKCFLPFVMILLFFGSCSKEKYPRIEYRVNSNSSATIVYTMVTSSLRQETVSGSWTVSFKHSKGGKVFLSALNSGLGSTSISVYVNKELLRTETTGIPGGLIEISEVLP
jgi:hypothetical protein